ncbi:hypothetical protein QTP86_023920 [Hemibagrus guttatus]|nr:hypothetical protein QTP86_023920 [Hemibagrus guttatus]
MDFGSVSGKLLYRACVKDAGVSLSWCARAEVDDERSRAAGRGDAVPPRYRGDPPVTGPYQKVTWSSHPALIGCWSSGQQ